MSIKCLAVGSSNYLAKSTNHNFLVMGLFHQILKHFTKQGHKQALLGTAKEGRQPQNQHTKENNWSMQHY